MHKLMNVLALLKPALEKADAIDKLADALLDTVEEFIQRTDNTVDDHVLLPAITGFRYLAGIADDDEKKPELEVIK